MDALKALAKASPAGLKLIESLQSFSASQEAKDQLASDIVTFLKQQGSTTKPGKENSGLEVKESGGKVCSTVEGVQLTAPRGKHDIIFHQSLMRLKSAKQNLEVPYSSIKNIAIIDIPKDSKKRVLLYLHLSGSNHGKAAKGTSNAVIIQVASESELDIPSPVNAAARLKGQAAIVLCQAFGALGLAGGAFTAPSQDVFASASSLCAVEAVVGVNQGWLIPLKEAICFLERPPLWIAHNEIATIEFARVGGGSSTFDMYVHTKDSQLLEFRNISRDELAGLSSYMMRHSLKIGDGEDNEVDPGDDAGPSGAANSDESDEEDSDFDPDGSESEEEPATGKAEQQDEEEEAGESGDSSSEDDDGSDSEVSVVSDEDLPSSKVRQLVQDAKQPKKKRRRIE